MAYEFEYASSNLTFDASVDTTSTEFEADFNIKDTVVINAYDVAVANGYVGTVTQWLESLHGAKGNDGYTPIKNVDYFDGEQGNEGYTPVKGVDYFDGKDGEKGEPFRFEDFTPEQLALLKGEKGDKGDKGEKGDDASVDLSAYATTAYVSETVDAFASQALQHVDTVLKDKADKSEIPDVSGKADKSEIPTVPKKVSAFENDAGYLKEHQDISGKLDTSVFNTAMQNANEALNSKVDNSQYQEALGNVKQTFGALENRLTTTAFTAEDAMTGLVGKADKEHTHDSEDIIPIAKKTYQNIIAPSNDNAGGAFYCFKVRPTSYYEVCRIKFKVVGYINESMTNANKAYYRQETICTMFLSGNALSAYQNKNWYYSSSYRPYYYTSVYRVSKAGYDAGLPHYVGVNLYNSANPTAATLKRDIEIELLEVEGCTVEMLDSMVKQGTFYSSANYAGISNCDAASAGVKQTGDANSIDRLCYGSYLPKALGSMYGTQLVLSADGENYFSICTSRSTNLNKTCNTHGFLPEHIMYYSNATTIGNGSRVGSSTLYEALPFDFRYSHNIKALTIHKPVYIKATYSEGLYYLATDGWMTQDVPTTEDGYYYILVGYSYSANTIYIKTIHPVYVYRGVLGKSSLKLMVVT